jgi:hypothetical protein
LTCSKKSKTENGSIEIAWIKTADINQVRKLEIVKFLRKTQVLKGGLSDFIIDESQLKIAFSGPAYRLMYLFKEKTDHMKSPYTKWFFPIDQ